MEENLEGDGDGGRGEEEGEVLAGRNGVGERI